MTRSLVDSGTSLGRVKMPENTEDGLLHPSLYFGYDQDHDLFLFGRAGCLLAYLTTERSRSRSSFRSCFGRWSRLSQSIRRSTSDFMSNRGNLDHEGTFALSSCLVDKRGRRASVSAPQRMGRSTGALLSRLAMTFAAPSLPYGRVQETRVRRPQRYWECCAATDTANLPQFSTADARQGAYALHLELSSGIDFPGYCHWFSRHSLAEQIPLAARPVFHTTHVPHARFQTHRHHRRQPRADRALAAELPAGMAAVPVIPGIIDTDMLRSCFGADAGGYPTSGVAGKAVSSSSGAGATASPWKSRSNQLPDGEADAGHVRPD